ncbi:hypothetical protein VKT23_006569 [Stygiomarasmius scandens]|uniref:Uncharacterized protein n=1 Tax=Marasmiellus scandens TaxID=2682957 RepID=A0ABR1JR07_9AGAR
MLKSNGIECWVGRHVNSEEIAHDDSTTQVENGVTTIRTTIMLKPKSNSLALSQWQLYWRKAEDAEPQSFWCVVRWTSATGKERVENQLWMSKVIPESQRRSTKDCKPTSFQMPKIKAVGSTNSMGTIRLELQRIRGDIKTKDTNDPNDVDYELEDQEASCVFIFQFFKPDSVKSTPARDGTAAPEMADPKLVAPVEVAGQPNTKKRLRISLRVATPEEKDHEAPPARRRRISDPRPRASGLAKLDQPERSSGIARAASVPFCPPPPSLTVQRIQSLPPLDSRQFELEDSNLDSLLTHHPAPLPEPVQSEFCAATPPIAPVSDLLKEASTLAPAPVVPSASGELVSSQAVSTADHPLDCASASALRHSNPVPANTLSDTPLPTSSGTAPDSHAAAVQSQSSLPPASPGSVAPAMTENAALISQGTALVSLPPMTPASGGSVIAPAAPITIDFSPAQIAAATQAVALILNQTTDPIPPPAPVPGSIPGMPMSISAPVLSSDSIPRMTVLPSTSLSFLPRELREAEELLRQQEEERMRLDNELAGVAMARLEKVRQQIEKFQTENEAKRRWLQACKDKGLDHNQNLI